MSDRLKTQLHRLLAFGVPACIFFLAGLFKKRQDLRFKFIEFLAAGAAHIKFHLAVRRNGIHRGAARDGAAGKGRSRIGAGLHIGHLGNGPAHGMNR